MQLIKKDDGVTTAEYAIATLAAVFLYSRWDDDGGARCQPSIGSVEIRRRLSDKISSS
jgi:hypothetical protein